MMRITPPLFLLGNNVTNICTGTNLKFLKLALPKMDGSLSSN